MKVKIVSCSYNTYWYANMIDSVFEVNDDPTSNNFIVVEQDGYRTHRFIDKTDAVVISKKDIIENDIKELEKKLQEAKQRLEYYDVIKEDEIKAGARFKYKDIIVTIIYLSATERYIFGGVNGNPFHAYFLSEFTASEMVNYLTRNGYEREE